ncbi:MAG: bifunctional riboflavin kinase/FAD synthetase [Campylobacterota bacterium]|nr:bifunctional riboflavin kinase/FAD synthetase [Campylobacterota bacterium]
MFWYYTELFYKSKKGIIIKSEITSIAIGGFDGMHLAHQQLFKKLDTKGGIVVIQTGYANLSPYTNRAEHTIYPLFYYPLDNIKHLSAQEFISLLNEEFPNLQKIVVGYDFHFGHKAAYDTNDLKTLFKGEVIVVDEYSLDNTSIHSRVIRASLREGDIDKANRLLGYNYKIKGHHIKGQGLGKKQFVPTINIHIEDFLIPAEAIYITKTIINKKEYKSVTFIGHRATTDGKFAVETHIVQSYDEDEFLGNLEVVFYKKIRANKKYDSFEELKEQILKDIAYSKEYFI